METKDQLNQSPEEQVIPNGEENTVSKDETKETIDSTNSQSGAEDTSGETNLDSSTAQAEEPVVETKEETTAELPQEEKSEVKEIQEEISEISETDDSPSKKPKAKVSVKKTTKKQKVKKDEEEQVTEEALEVKDTQEDKPEISDTDDSPVKEAEIEVPEEKKVKKKEKQDTSETKEIEDTQKNKPEVSKPDDFPSEEIKDEIPATEATNESDNNIDQKPDDAKESSSEVKETPTKTDEPVEKKVEEVINYAEMLPEELVTILETIVQENEVTVIRNKVALIKVAFLKHIQSIEEKQLLDFIAEGGEKTNFTPQKTNVDIRFNDAFKIYSKKRKVFLAELEKEKQSNLEAKKIILEELKALIDSEESLKKTYDEFKVLQEKWRELGMVPKGEVNNLWQSYHFLVEKFFDKVKINRELRDLDMKKNLESKIDLCEKAEELLIEKSIIKSFKQLQQLHAKWKEVGPVQNDKKEELWERFKGVTDKINKLRRDHYNEIKDEQKNNFIAKTALCEKAEELLKKENTSIKEWQHNTDEMSELLKVWKTIGQAPRGQNDEIWDRFRISLDTFFASKKEFYQQIKEVQNNNYNLKLDLCVQAEALKDNTDWKITTHDLINLQKEWKKVGPVPRKHSDKIWKRFRASCDEFFHNKSEYFGNIKQHENENMEQKTALVAKVLAFEFSDNKKENLNVIKEFQRSFTEIGHVPFKDKETIQSDFRNAINQQLDKLNIKRTEMQAINFKQKFENLKDNPNAGKIISGERIYLVQKRKKLEEEAQLLENNMGFLAKSKKADLLKQEFMKKIENARNEMALISEKIKFLNREDR